MNNKTYLYWGDLPCIAMLHGQVGAYYWTTCPCYTWTKNCCVHDPGDHTNYKLANERHDFIYL
jgi:hypothetical protein